MNKILDKIKEDNLKARKEKNKFISNILTTLIGEIRSIGKNKGNRETTEEETIKMITKFKKTVFDTIILLDKSGYKEDELEKYRKEMLVYKSYLPKLISKEELEILVDKFISEIDNPNIGMIMGKLKKSGKNFNGKLASTIVKEKLK